MIKTLNTWRNLYLNIRPLVSSRYERKTYFDKSNTPLRRGLCYVCQYVTDVVISKSIIRSVGEQVSRCLGICRNTLSSALLTYCPQYVLKGLEMNVSIRTNNRVWKSHFEDGQSFNGRHLNYWLYKTRAFEALIFWNRKIIFRPRDSINEKLIGITWFDPHRIFVSYWQATTRYNDNNLSLWTYCKSVIGRDWRISIALYRSNTMLSLRIKVKLLIFMSGLISFTHVIGLFNLTNYSQLDELVSIRWMRREMSLTFIVIIATNSMSLFLDFIQDEKRSRLWLISKVSPAINASIYCSLPRRSPKRR